MCVLICDSGTVNGDKFLKGLTTYFKKNGLNRTAFDYQGNPNVRMMYGDKGGVQPSSSKPENVEEEKKESQQASSNNKKLSAAERKKLKKEQQKKSEPEIVETQIEVPKAPPSKDFKLNLNKSPEEQ